ncbi:hypothetical protein R0131_00190 [Clostridium sp. AL.422]|uniref:hypothetical protein n=1 Tax=Clostridium TaxID=1485 RepID=UPI00293DEC1A|nr:MULTISPECIES: hypothetical protein [unclassified Clostridium]MDV4149246.1 hypothetical protein [Clostridium sp. AL.422]
MKKLLIGMLITCSLGLAACGKGDVENPSTTNNSGTGVAEGTNGSNKAGTSDKTNSNTNGTNNQGSAVNDNMASVNGLYTEFKGKVEGGIDNIKTEDWDEYSTEFRDKLTNLRNTAEDTSMRSTLDDMENLFNQYDTAIRDKTDISKDKVQEMQDRIEDAFK